MKSIGNGWPKTDDMHFNVAKILGEDNYSRSTMIFSFKAILIWMGQKFIKELIKYLCSLTS